MIKTTGAGEEFKLGRLRIKSRTRFRYRIRVPAEQISPGAELPLDGSLVLDFTRILSGPFATMLLADLGADVVKVERPVAGDDTRSWGPPFHDGTSTYFSAINRGKRSVAADLASEEGRGLIRSLACKADVLVENFRPGVMERLGLSYGALCEDNPGLIYASINGYGSDGPKSQVAGSEIIIEAETGLMDMMGTPDGPPVRFGVAMVDIATGISAVSGILAGMLSRAKSGTGRYLEFPLYTTAFSCLATVIASASVDQSSQEGRWGSGHPSLVPYAAFEAADGYVVLGAMSENMWERLCDGLEIMHLLDDSRCASNEVRVANRDWVEAQVGAAVRTHTVREVQRRLGDHGVLCAPVQPAHVAIEDPQVASLGLIDRIEGLPFARSPLAQFNPRALSPAPGLGEHTAEVLAEYLGRSSQAAAMNGVGKG